MTVQWARTITGDMHLPKRGDGTSAIERDPRTCARIKLLSVLAFVLGEWALDTSEGFPWPSIWGQKNPNLVSIRHVFRKYILGTPPVVAVEDLAVTYARGTRAIDYRFTARIAGGQAVTVP